MNELIEVNASLGFNNTASFELTLRAAKMLSTSSLVPKDYQGQAGIANCAIALNMSQRMNADPLMILQNLVIVHGRPTWSSQFLIATFNSCGRYSSLKFEFFGEKNTDSWGCRAVSTELSTGEKLIGPEVSISLAKMEGWHGRNGSKWKTIPELMLRYRAAAWFIRTVAPELSMGLHTQEEIYDIEEKEINPVKTRKSKTVADILEPQEMDVSDAKIDVESGEILDELTDLRVAINECKTIEEFENLTNSFSTEIFKKLGNEIETKLRSLNV